ncbi:response regulator transcription factor [Natranaerobius trueperi]|uniref:Stage 0 sporulation protein A homolog n=1 Tax=Natranaerobius trueperi TaxID=759412 RepID=A0A226C3D6_9FIRM|nr:response regulator transcription factor [Natranaerobius trueperi]OWZ84937.1 DNA-binding response regulator [Natranaerobius trueperi]
MTKILIIEDEQGLSKVLNAYLSNEGYRVKTVSDGKTGLTEFTNWDPDLVVLDLMLPYLSGEEVAKSIRLKKDTPIIMLTAKGKEDDRVYGLGIGADDYLVKPFSQKELLARIKAILRRKEQSSNRTQQDIITVNNLSINTIIHKIYLNDEELVVTPTEYHLLKIFMTHPNRVFSREHLVEIIFGYMWESEHDPRTIDAHIKNLRKKIEPDPKKPSFIKTVHGLGYKFGGVKNE